MDTGIIEKKEFISKAEPADKRLLELKSQLAKEKASRKRKRKIVKKISDVIFYLAMALIVIAALLFSAGNKGVKKILGYSFFTVLSESMQSVYPKGSLVVVKHTDANLIKAGDNITFYVSPNASVTHQVIEVLENYENSGQRAFRTKGIDNEEEDRQVVYAANVVGTVTYSLKDIGNVLSYISSNIWLFFVIMGIMFFLSFSIRLFFTEGKKKKHAKRAQLRNDMFNRKSNIQKEKLQENLS